jgi:putative phage-type endonuclease
MNDLQRTDEWYEARLGKVTASRVADVMAKTKSGYSASRANYMAQLICERLTGTKGESFQNAAMAWGTEQEPAARGAYEARTGLLVQETGFVPHPTIPGAGASPDGLVGDDGLVEIKCPNTATHIETLLGGSTALKYRDQMMMQMACTGRQWCDFVSFDPRMPANMQLFVVRVLRDDKAIAEMEDEIRKFLAEMEAKLAKLEGAYNGV